MADTGEHPGGTKMGLFRILAPPMFFCVKLQENQLNSLGGVAMVI